MTAVHTKLGEICIVRRGTTITKKQTIEGEVPVIGGGTKPTYFHNESNRKANCITISGSGASAGFVNKWDVPIFASDCSTVEPKDNTQLSNFIYYFLLSQQEYIYKNFRSGAAQPHVYAKDLASLEYPILPISEQQRIVTKLDAVFAEIDEAINKAEAKETEVQKLKTSLLSSFFSNNTTEWRETTLGDYYDVRDGTHDSPKYIQDGFPLVTSKNLKNGRIDLTKVKYISKEDYEDINRRSRVSVGDVLMAMIGTIGSPVEIIDPPNCAIKNVALFKTNEEQSPAFLFYFLSNPHTILKMMADAKGTTQKFVGLGYLRSFPISVPKLEVQEQIAEKLKSVYVELENANDSILKIKTHYQALKSAILDQELQSGEVA